MYLSRRILLVITFATILISCCVAKKKSRKLRKGMILRQKETNAVDFIRLVVMRLIYGVAVRLGFGENIAEALNGVFVPPGVDDYDNYGGFNASEDEDDYDY